MGASIVDSKTFPNPAIFSADGNVLLTGTRLWKPYAAKVLSAPLAVRYDSDIVACSSDGLTILTSGAHLKMQEVAQLWRADSGKPVGAPMMHGRPIQHATFSPDGRSVATTCGEKVHLWQADSGKPVGNVLAHLGPVERLLFRPDGRALLTTGQEHAQLWSVDTEKPIGPPITYKTRVQEKGDSKSGA